MVKQHFLLVRQAPERIRLHLWSCWHNFYPFSCPICCPWPCRICCSHRIRRLRSSLGSIVVRGIDKLPGRVLCRIISVHTHPHTHHHHHQPNQTKRNIPSFFMPSPTQAPNLERENARPPHCSCIAYRHCTPAVWHRPHSGRCSSHFCRRALQRLQPVNDRDIPSVFQYGCLPPRSVSGVCLWGVGVYPVCCGGSVYQVYRKLELN